MKQRIRDIIFLIVGILLTIIFFTIIIPFLAIVGLVKIISILKQLKNKNKYVKIN